MSVPGWTICLRDKVKNRFKSLLFLPCGSGGTDKEKEMKSIRSGLTQMNFTGTVQEAFRIKRRLSVIPINKCIKTDKFHKGYLNRTGAAAPKSILIFSRLLERLFWVYWKNKAWKAGIFPCFCPGRGGPSIKTKIIWMDQEHWTVNEPGILTTTISLLSSLRIPV